jgi:hypothetical protein
MVVPRAPSRAAPESRPKGGHRKAATGKGVSNRKGDSFSEDKSENARETPESIGDPRGLGLGSQKRPAVRLLTVGLYYISAASNSAVVPKGTKS